MGRKNPVAAADLDRNPNLSLREWPETERPRERLCALGPDALSLTELAAVLLGHGGRGFHVLGVAQAVVERLAGNAGTASLRGIKGVGPSQAARIVAAVEFGLRLQALRTSRNPGRIVHSRDAVAVVEGRIAHLPSERFLVLSLDIKNRPLAVEEVARGSSEAVTLTPRDVFEKASAHRASAVICAHNHPSGDPAPSAEDVELTRRLAEGAKILGIRFLDHVIVGSGGTYFSFADAGRLR